MSPDNRLVCPHCGEPLGAEFILRSASVPKAGRDAIRARAEEFFHATTGLKPPANKKAAGALWYAPLREICELVDWSAARAEDLIYAAVKKLEQSQLTISDPNSILKTVRAIAASGAKMPERRQSAAEFLEKLG